MVVTGVEVAGLVLAVIPVLLPLLDEYRDGMKRTAIFFKRKKHVEKLAKALLIQRVLLAENVRTLLLRIEVDDVPEAPIDLFRLLNRNDVKQRMEDYLGKEAYRSYSNAVSSSDRVVMRLIKAIDGFLPILQPSTDDIISLIEASNAVSTGQLAFRKRAKLTLSYQDMESSILDLNHSIMLLERLHQAVSRRHEIAASSIDRKATRVASSLQVARVHAINLFNALMHSWNTSCHQEHEAKLYLDGARILNNQEDALSTYFKRQNILDFRLILSSKDAGVSKIWHESTIKVLEDDGNTENPPIPSINVPRVNIITPITISPEDTIAATDVPNLCTTIAWAARERKMLRWYLASQQRIRYQHEECTSHLVSICCQSVSLENVLSRAQPSSKIGLKNRMLLALNLASTLLQLQSTPWLANSWSKRSIEFLKRPALAAVSMQAPGSAQPATAYHSAANVVDYQHPVISQRFSISPQHVDSTTSLPPKEALLELGIMLLEIWHETTLETFYSITHMGTSGTPMPTDYWNRFMLASMWLDDPNDQPLPLYHTAISQCVKCFFGGTFSSPNWDDANFRKALCKDLVGPLYESCKQWM